MASEHTITHFSLLPQHSYNSPNLPGLLPKSSQGSLGPTVLLSLLFRVKYGLKNKISTHFLTIVKNLKFSLSPTVYVCVCVCVERERERERELYPFPDLPTPKYMSVLQTVFVFSDLWLDYLVCFVVFVFFCGCTTNQSRQTKKCQRTIFRQTCSIALWTPTPVSNAIPIPNSISAILNISWSFTSEFKGLQTKFIRL